VLVNPQSIEVQMQFFSVFLCCNVQGPNVVHLIGPECMHCSHLHPHLHSMQDEQPVLLAAGVVGDVAGQWFALCVPFQVFTCGTQLRGHRSVVNLSHTLMCEARLPGSQGVL
jgi:hypothetical protein